VKKIVGVSRISTLRQLRNGRSKDYQVKQIRTFAKKKGFQVAYISEVQASGRKQLINRGQLSQTIKKANDLKADIVCTKLDRLSRDTLTLLTLRRASLESGVEIWISSMDRKISEISDIEFNFLSVWSEHEAKIAVERTKALTKDRIGSFGTILDPKEMNRRSVMKRVKLMQKWALSVNLKGQIQEAIFELKSPTLANVSRWLNGNDLPTRSGKKWNRLNLSQQVARLGWNWKELCKAHLK